MRAARVAPEKTVFRPVLLRVIQPELYGEATMSEDWKWWNENKDGIAVPQVDAIAVYLNAEGDVVIRQRGSMGNEDSMVVFPRRNLEDVILALQNVGNEQ